MPQPSDAVPNRTRRVKGGGTHLPLCRRRRRHRAAAAAAPPWRSAPAPAPALWFAAAGGGCLAAGLLTPPAEAGRAAPASSALLVRCGDAAEVLGMAGARDKLRSLPSSCSSARTGACAPRRSRPGHGDSGGMHRCSNLALPCRQPGSSGSGGSHRSTPCRTIWKRIHTLSYSVCRGVAVHALLCENIQGLPRPA